MRKPIKTNLLDEAVGLLVRHFGITKVQSSLAQLEQERDSNRSKSLPIAQSRKSSGPNIAVALRSLKGSEPGKYHLLADFYDQLKSQSILPEAQDIRHFAQLVGLKQLSGKSRKELIPKLMIFLVGVPTDRLGSSLYDARAISDQQRQKGFSVLTDKLLGEK